MGDMDSEGKKPARATVSTLRATPIDDARRASGEGQGEVQAVAEALDDDQAGALVQMLAANWDRLPWDETKIET